jgi:hypothetical protein
MPEVNEGVRGRASKEEVGHFLLSLSTFLQGFSICLWQYSQSPLIVEPSAAVCDESWHRKQPVEVMWPRLVG